MESLFLLIPLAIIIVAIAVGIFFWAVKSGQFEDLDRESKRILFDDEAGDKSATRDGSPPKTLATESSRPSKDKESAALDSSLRERQ